MNTFHRCFITYRFFSNGPSYYIYISCPALTQKVKENIFYWTEMLRWILISWKYVSFTKVVNKYISLKMENFGYCFVSDSMCYFSSRKANDWYCAISYILCCVLSGGQRQKFNFQIVQTLFSRTDVNVEPITLQIQVFLYLLSYSNRLVNQKKWYSYTISIPNLLESRFISWRVFLVWLFCLFQSIFAIL